MAYLMIVDDDEDFTAALAMTLQAAGYEVEVECDPAVALKKMVARAPDLAIVDVMFPEDASGGFVLARSLRQRTDALRSIRILMLTAVNEKFPLGFGAQDIDDDWLPVSDFLEKPVDLRLLPQRIEALLAK
jgi:two-component system OmpR family response regulator